MSYTQPQYAVPFSQAQLPGLVAMFNDQDTFSVEVDGQMLHGMVIVKFESIPKKACEAGYVLLCRWAP